MLEKEKALEIALSQIEKSFGKGAIMKLGDASRVPVSVIPTGCLDLDLALGVGGVPRGRVIEVYGPESSGKTTLALHVIAEAQKNGGTAAFVDAEHALDPVYAKKLGVNIDELIVSQPDTGEQALDIAESLVRSGAVDVVVVDSVAALIPKAELEGEIGDSVVGVLARLMSQAMRRLAGAISKNNCTVIFINQLRQKIGVMYGNPETTPGGLALKYYASVRLDVRRVESLKVNGEVIGNHTRVKVVKNKVAPPFKEAEFDIMYGEGISKIGEIIDLAVKLEIIDKGGAWFTVADQRIQGRDSVKQYLIDNPEICEKIESEVRSRLLKQVQNSSKAPVVGALDRASGE
jgi:recombination protein RecA